MPSQSNGKPAKYKFVPSPFRDRNFSSWQKFELRTHPSKFECFCFGFSFGFERSQQLVAFALYERATNTQKQTKSRQHWSRLNSREWARSTRISLPIFALNLFVFLSSQSILPAELSSLSVAIIVASIWFPIYLLKPSSGGGQASERASWSFGIRTANLNQYKRMCFVPLFKVPPSW